MTVGSNNPFPTLLIVEGTAPASPAAGQQRAYIDSTTHHLTRKNSSGTVVDIETAAAYTAQLDYVQVTSNTSITATTEATANTIVTGSGVAYDGSTAVMIEFWTVGATPGGTAGNDLTGWLYDGSSSIGSIAYIVNQAAGTHYMAFGGRVRITPSAATHTYSIRASVSAGTGQVLGGASGTGAQFPTFIRITRAV